MSVLLLVLLSLLGFQQTTVESGSVTGRVIDSTSGDPLARVDVQLQSLRADGTEYRAITDNDGAFRLNNVPGGDYVLHVSPVGYYLFRQTLTLDSTEMRELEVVLTPSSGRRSDSVEVRASPFEIEAQDSPGELSLAGDEMKNLASVLADDPLRAVQGLPGVTSNNDFNAEFSLRGADFSRIGIYLDGVLLHEPFHHVEGQGQTGSLTAFNGDILDDLTLYEGAWPVRFSDRTAGILAMNTRDGSSKQPSIRLSAGMTDVAILGEGPLTKNHRGSWIVSFRKSYLQYLLDRIQTPTQLIFGFTDGQAKITYDVSRKHTLSLTLMQGNSALDRSAGINSFGQNSLVWANFDTTSGNLTSRYTPSGNFLLTSRTAWFREKGSANNKNHVSLGSDSYGEWVGSSDATRSWRHGTLGFGVSLRRVRDDGNVYQYQGSPLTLFILDRFRGTTVVRGGYAQQTVNLIAGHLQLTAGARYDRSSVVPRTIAVPYASIVVQPLSSTRVSLAWGQYGQFPEIAQSESIFGSPQLAPQRATHVEAAIDQNIDYKTRLRLEFYNRQDRDLLARPLADPRMLSIGTVSIASNTARWLNSQRGYARGAQLFVQRRATNGVTGWVSYAYGVSNVRDGVLQLTYPTDNDQRHTVNVFGSYRLRSTVNLSLKWSYGTGLPIPGFFQPGPKNTYLLAGNRNQMRLPDYQRLDFRTNKIWAKDKWKATLFFEMVNVLNHTNQRYDSFNGYNLTTKQAFPTFFKMLPILPSIGVVFER